MILISRLILIFFVVSLYSCVYKSGIIPEKEVVIDLSKGYMDANCVKLFGVRDKDTVTCYLQDKMKFKCTFRELRFGGANMPPKFDGYQKIEQKITLETYFLLDTCIGTEIRLDSTVIYQAD